MLANQSVCLHFTRSANQNTSNLHHVNKRSEKRVLSSKPPVQFDIYFFTLKLKNSYKMAFFHKLYRRDFLNLI